MQITEVRIYPADDGILRAYASITLDNCWMVRNLKIIRNDSGGFYVAMPSKNNGTAATGRSPPDYGRSVSYD
jgi:stage V sporulation protein G